MQCKTEQQWQDGIILGGGTDIVSWCRDHHLNQNTRRTKEMICDFWMLKVTVLTGLQNTREEVEHISDVKFLGLHLYPHNQKIPSVSTLCMLKRNKRPSPLLNSMYCCIIVSWHMDARCSAPAAGQAAAAGLVEMDQWMMASTLGQELHKPPPPAHCKGLQWPHLYTNKSESAAKLEES